MSRSDDILVSESDEGGLLEASTIIVGESDESVWWSQQLLSLVKVMKVDGRDEGYCHR